MNSIAAAGFLPRPILNPPSNSLTALEATRARSKDLYAQIDRMAQPRKFRSELDRMDSEIERENLRRIDAMA